MNHTNSFPNIRCCYLYIIKTYLLLQVLSRAFRNRFIELHFNEIPGPDLEIILQLRCDMPASYSRKLVAVMSDLQVCTGVLVFLVRY